MICRGIHSIALSMVVDCALAVAASPAGDAAELPVYQGPCALVASHDGRTLYVANADARQVACVDVDRDKIVRKIPTPERPTGVALDADGDRLFVTCAGPQGVVCVVNTATGRIAASIPVGHTPMGPVVSPDGGRLYVCNRFDGDMSVLDVATGKELARVPLCREPVAAAITPDGKSVVVANHLPVDPADKFFVAASVSIIDTQTHQTTHVRLPNGAASLRGVCILPGGSFALVTHILSNYELVPSQVVGGWTNTNVISVIDVAQKKLVDTVLLDDRYLGAANPWAVGCTADGRSICISHAGTHELSVIDAPAMFRRLVGAAPGTVASHDEHAGAGYSLRTSPTVGGIPNSPGILEGTRRRIGLPGKGPRAIAVAGSKVYVAQYFSDTVDVVDLQADGELLRGIALGSESRPTARRRGERLFHDATICYQQWQSCASCHPDGRVDCLNWDLTNDGVGNPKNTKSMLYAHRTPPAMAAGVRASAELAVRHGITHTLFSAQPEDVAEAMDEYLKSLHPVPSPHLVDGELSPAARRGKELFESPQIGCGRCHPAPLYTDLRPHDVGTAGPYDHRDRFDTPTLIEVWRTAPYLHDGRYTTIEALLTRGRHGLKGERFLQLDQRQIRDLIEFVQSL